MSLTGCTHPVQQPHAAPPKSALVVKQAPPTPVQEKRVELGGPTWDPQWDALIERSLPPALETAQVPRDVRRFCPHFFGMNTLDKKTYWAYFFQALAAAESGLDTRTNVLHSSMQGQTDRVTKHLIRSEGLLQMTYEDRERYGCDFDWQNDRHLALKDGRKTILQPQNGLLCGIKILDRQIISQHKPLFAATSYWSTLRSGTASYQVFAKQMTNPPAACELGTSKPRPGRHEVALAAGQP